MHPRPQEIITAALELRDRLADESALGVPFVDGESPEYPSADRGGAQKEPSLLVRDAVYAERVRIASELAKLLDPRIPAGEMLEAAAGRRDEAWGRTVSFSPKVFVDLTRLCRDRCAYCTFVRNPLSVIAAAKGHESRYSAPGASGGSRSSTGSVSTSSRHPLGVSERGPAPYLLPEEVLAIAEEGRRSSCREALFTLGDRPEDRYPVARKFLTEMGYDSTPHYLYECARLVMEETGLLPHLNPGVMTAEELRSYRDVSASCGMMLETTSLGLFSDPSGCHHGSPDKHPAVRIATIEAAGAEKVPFTTGVLIGIGESLEARADTLLVLAALALRHCHIQEVIVQNFRAKPVIPMRDHPEPSTEEMLRAVALARLLLPDRVAVQAPPNLSPGCYGRLLEAGLSDWGGVSPVTLDHVNPEAAWPDISELAEATEAMGFGLRARLCVYPSFVTGGEWISELVRPHVERISDGEGWAVVDEPLASELGYPSRPEFATGPRG